MIFFDHRYFFLSITPTPLKHISILLSIPNLFGIYDTTLRFIESQELQKNHFVLTQTNKSYCSSNLHLKNKNPFLFKEANHVFWIGRIFISKCFRGKKIRTRRLRISGHKFSQSNKKVKGLFGKAWIFQLNIFVLEN